jgi:hypothetical protein
MFHDLELKNKIADIQTNGYTQRYMIEAIFNTCNASNNLDKWSDVD